MSNCGCNDNVKNTFDALQACEPTVSKEVCVDTEITVTPTVSSGTPIVRCIGPISTNSCAQRGFTPSTSGSCTFTVSQVLCISVPLAFDATTEVATGQVSCGETFNGPNCENLPPEACAYTRGFYLNHEEETLALLELAGGTILLGNGTSTYSLTITETNIFDVLAGTVGDSPQYRQLYTQLLTAKLNVLNGATCPSATNTIALADLLLSQDVMDNDLAEQLQTLLEQFNSGEAPGCPPHCPEEE